MRLSDIFRRFVSHFSSNRSDPVETAKETKQPLPSLSSGTSLGKPKSENMPGLTAQKSKYDAIPGPLGLASASLEGKVALVTGAGTLCLSLSPIARKSFFGRPACTLSQLPT